ncbi:hypothetical protein LY13_002489 [Prauserella aidingensis]|uniref:hypothetical protein n=1 Tax=Prauserella aidingensis TaxID=387890 RepID=UPI0020A4782A|nr:hypothetical protein [Prauserella aidingensis]MCP2253735.1 hypothetical protein [Prauserella aidingensis]
MSDETRANDNKWAPWWAYVVIIAGCNIVKQPLIEPYGIVLNVIVTIALVAGLFVLITAVYRGLAKPKQDG